MEDSFEDEDDLDDDDEDYLNLNEDEGKAIVRLDGPLVLTTFCRRCLGRGIHLHGGTCQGGEGVGA